jgi:subtilisin family serine protease
MKYTFSLVAILMSSFASQLSAQSTIAPKLSPMTSLFLKDKKQLVNMLPQNYIYKQDALGQKFLSAMIKVNSSINDVDIYTIGAKVGTKAGMVWTVSIPVSQLEQFLKISGLEYVALDEPLSNTMDAARLVTRTDSVHKGFAPLGTAYYGNNTVVGIIDAGFDYNHPTLRDTTGAQWRIKRVWEQKTIGTAPTGFSFGHEMKDSTTIKTKATDLLKFSHGTHVAGIAAGSGWGSAANSQYRGIAFGSDMVLVGITPDTSQWTGTGMSDIIDGMNYIYQYAASVAKPAVANLSWGGPLGPHDGTSLFSQACDALTGKGKIFVCSGGNNGSNNIHLAKTFTISDTIINSELIPNSAINKVWMDIWGDSSKKFCAQISMYNGSSRSDSTGYICLDNTLRSFSLMCT